MRITLITLLVLFVQTAYAEDDRAVLITELLSQAIIGDEKDLIMAELKQNGLDDQTAEATVKTLGTGVATCVIEAIRLYALTQSESFEDHMNMLESALEAGDVESYLDSLPEAEMKMITQDCIRSEFRNANLDH